MHRSIIILKKESVKFVKKKTKKIKKVFYYFFRSFWMVFDSLAVLCSSFSWRNQYTQRLTFTSSFKKNKKDKKGVLLLFSLFLDGSWFTGCIVLLLFLEKSVYSEIDFHILFLFLVFPLPFFFFSSLLSAIKKCGWWWRDCRGKWKGKGNCKSQGQEWI